jgi:hypothetical protein
MCEWSNEELIRWLNKNQDFQDYAKIVRYNEYTGSEFAQQAVEKRFLRETLGMFRDDLQVKIITEINQAAENRYKPYKLYGWGKNEFGQLGLAVSNNIQMAATVPLPKLDDDDEIQSIQCGWKNSGKAGGSENI